MDDFENPTEMENCKHKFCQECFHSYLVDKVTHNQIEQIPCPKKNCKNKELSENFISKYLTEQEYFKYRQFKAQNEIAKDSKKVFCPLCDSYADIEEGQDILYDSNNPDYVKSTLKCQNGHEFCSCGRPKHEGDCYAGHHVPFVEAAKRLKSLRPQPHWKPSNLELGALRTAISVLTEERNFQKAGKHLQDILDHFEGKETRHDWKPSEEQMEALHYVKQFDTSKTIALLSRN